MAAITEPFPPMPPNTPNLLAPMLMLAETNTQGFAFWLAIGLISVGCTVIATVLIVIARPRRNASTFAYAAPTVGSGADAATSNPVTSFTSHTPTPTTDEAQMLLRLMGEAEELCTRLGSELDAKADRVERLLARLDGRLGSAEVIVRPNTPIPPPPQSAPVSMSSAPATPPPSRSPASGEPAPAAPPPPSLTRTPPAIPSPLSPARPEIVTRPIAVPAAMAAAPAPEKPARAHSEAAAEIDPLMAQVYKLADAGLPTADIARTLGQYAGKVELILALRGR